MLIAPAIQAESPYRKGDTPFAGLRGLLKPDAEGLYYRTGAVLIVFFL